MIVFRFLSFFFFFNDTATTEIYTLSLHDALPISDRVLQLLRVVDPGQFEDPDADPVARDSETDPGTREPVRSEEHTSELQSPCNLVCRLLLETKKKVDNNYRQFLASDILSYSSCL